MKHLQLFLLTAIICSCSISHNRPLSQTPNEFIEPNIVKVFVDQNGTFYPNDWKNTYGEHPKNARRFAYSLNTIAKRTNHQEELIRSQNEILKNIEAKANGKKRIFILVHGYNNDETSAHKSFNRIQEKIDYSVENDLFIQYYWDGLVSNTVSGSLKIWFNATGYSQLAGEFGLRKVLNLLSDKEIIIITHSRGASVLLSSLSNPPYAAQFRKQTKDYHDIEIGNKTPLAENRNIIKCIMLAPAVGAIDFQNDTLGSYRAFSGQVEKFQITINDSDPKLKKYVGFLSDNFNPTNLGYSSKVYQGLKTVYPIIDSTDYSGMQSHAFIDYVNSVKFIEMLHKFNVRTK